MRHKPQNYIRYVRRAARLQARQLTAWWQRNDRRYGVWWRLGNGVLALLLLVSAVIPVAQQFLQTNQYRLSAEALQLVGSTNPALKKQLTYDAGTQTYQFNKAAVDAASANPLTKLKSQVGTANGSSKDKSLYGLDVPTDLSKGVTYHDINSQLSFSLVPQFKTGGGQEVQGHLVYPMAGGSQAVYTLKGNGLKEDVVVPAGSKTDAMMLSYKLNLPKSLEAKAIPDSNGAIGIYSADPALFGDISYGSSKDQTSVQNARNNSPKTNLVFGLPAPVIKTTDGSQTGSARFQLSGNTLSVIASGLAEQKTAVTIDPSVVVTATSDFQTGGNNDSNIDFSTSGQINRGGLTGGSLSGGWSTTTGYSFASCGGVGSAAYNGYLYIAGCSGAGTTAVRYAPINSDGTIGTMNSATSMNTARGFFRMEVYNGYLYAIGGTNGSSYYNSVEAAPINSDGTLGTWTSTSSFTTGRSSFGSAVYNGYLYIMGGYDGTNPKNDVQYAPINADGTLGTWTSTTSFTTTRTSLGAAVYNGYLYIMGGYNAASTYYNDVQYAKLASDGTVGSWTATSSFTTARAGQEFTVVNGYAYLMGGTANVGSSLTDTQYAPIYANGTLGTWVSSSTLNTGVWSAGTVAYNGYLYIVAGRVSSGTDTNIVQYAKIDPAGTIMGYNSTTAISTPTITAAGIVAYNGYLYIIGGYTGSAYVTTVKYTTIGSSGALGGSWTTATNSLGTAVGLMGAAVYNGYLYTVGGTTTGGSIISTVQYSQIGGAGAPGAWGTTTDFPDPSGVSNHQTLAYNGYLYGFEGNQTQTMWYAPLSTTNGTAGTWVKSTNSLNTARQLEGAVIYGGYMYVAGGLGSSGTVPLTSVEYAQINSDGSLGTWTATASMLLSRSYFNLVASGGYLYAQGGATATGAGTPTATTEFSRIKSDGSLDTWAYNTSMPATYSKPQVAAYNGVLYTVGGIAGGTRTTASYYAPLNNGGSGATGTWTTNSTDLSAPYSNCIGYNQVFAANGYLYTVGGYTVSAGCSSPFGSGGTAFSSAYYAPINSDGSVGSWTATSSMNTARYQFGLIVNNGFVYALGGSNSSGNALASTEYASINSTGGLGTWTTGSNLGTAVRQLSATSYNGRVYVLGGLNTSSAAQALVQYASLNTDGSIAAWGTTTSFPTARSYFASFAYNGYIYVAGGSGASNAILSDTQYAPINSDGTISSGAWIATTSLVVGVRQPVGMAANGFAYVFGGYNGSQSYFAPAQIAAINANGSLSTYTPGTAYSSTSRNAASATIYNGRLYMLGGYSSATGYLKDVQYTPLNTTARIAYYSKLIDLGATVNVTGLTYNGNLPAGPTAITYKAAGSNGIFGSSSPVSGINATGACTGSVANTRYLYISITLDDSYGKGIGGAYADISGTPANLTDFTVSYNANHPAPNIRLRAGQTLQSGNLSALDTCGP